MKHIFYLLLISVLSLSCTKDDSGKDCDSNCTTLTGRIFAADGVGIENAELSFYYRTSGNIGSFTRIIASGKTDVNGSYTLIGFVEDDELDISRGSLKLEIDIQVLSSVTPDKYLKADGIISGNANVEISPENIRNNTIVNDFIVPEKSILNLNLRDFRPTATGDSFGTAIGSNFGRQNPDWFYIVEGAGSGGTALENTNPTVITVNSVLNDTAYINIIKIKDGVEERTLNKIFIENPTTEIDYYY